MSIVLHGVAAGKGIAVGCAHLIARGTEEVPQYDVAEADTDAEAERFDAAVKATRKELEQLRSAIPENAPTELGAFISLHLMLLTDVTLSREPVDILREQKINAEWALKQQSDKLAAQFDNMDDAYLRERKQDMLQDGGRYGVYPHPAWYGAAPFFHESEQHSARQKHHPAQQYRTARKRDCQNRPLRGRGKGGKAD